VEDGSFEVGGGSMSLKILVTGGEGYVGQAVIAALQGFQILSMDNNSNSHREGMKVGGNVCYETGDVRDYDDCRRFAEAFRPNVLIHTAAEADVPKSLEDPLYYFNANVIGTLNIVEATHNFGCQRVLFSSSAAVYTPGKTKMLEHEVTQAPATPYGLSKLQSEQQLACLHQMDITCFRYFNVAGAFKIQDHWVKERRKKENHIIPNLLQAATTSEVFTLTGATTIRDYVDIRDVAQAHVAALSRRFECNRFNVYNIGSGHETSNLGLAQMAELVWDREIEVDMKPTRPGDPDYLVADSRAMQLDYRWRAHQGVERILKSVWESRHSL
jgi:UDP-glucose 4-epimerase